MRTTIQTTKLEYNVQAIVCNLVDIREYALCGSGGDGTSESILDTTSRLLALTNHLRRLVRSQADPRGSEKLKDHRNGARRIMKGLVAQLDHDDHIDRKKKEAKR